MEREAFLADRRALNSAKYLLIVAAEAALDICNHVAARRGGRSPEDYADCIAILAEIGAIDDVLRQRLVRMARFRNLLVHLYWKVADAETGRLCGATPQGPWQVVGRRAAGAHGRAGTTLAPPAAVVRCVAWG
jgi:uncharacterized protein YutE (UPF0331/DUF86 family)